MFYTKIPQSSKGFLVDREQLMVFGINLINLFTQRKTTPMWWSLMTKLEPMS